MMSSFHINEVSCSWKSKLKETPQGNFSFLRVALTGFLSPQNYRLPTVMKSVLMLWFSPKQIPQGETSTTVLLFTWLRPVATWGSLALSSKLAPATMWINKVSHLFIGHATMVREKRPKQIFNIVNFHVLWLSNWKERHQRWQLHSWINHAKQGAISLRYKTGCVFLTIKCASKIGYYLEGCHLWQFTDSQSIILCCNEASF